ncbi:MAG: hypothetical protein LBH13_00910 [Cellulomonadaceae bacterium]|jgi:hypothetical protein|nr:hypothetical protein [Cellulomonadaceae bacterium]
MPAKEQIAHDLAMVYVVNRHGAAVTGSFEVSSDDDGVEGDGSVKTERLPDVGTINYRSEGTGKYETRTGGFLWNKYEFEVELTVDVPDGRVVDTAFEAMIEDYIAAYARFLHLLGERSARPGQP